MSETSSRDRLDHNKDRLDHTQALLDQITQIIGPQTPTGKALIGARDAFNSGDLKLTQQRLYNAFDTLKPSDSSVSLQNDDEAMTTSEKNVIEKTIAWLLQKPQTTSVTKQEIIDNLLNQSYQTLRQTGSRASWRYLLEALDKAGIPLDETSPQLQKTLMNITQKLIPANFIGLSDSSGQSGQVGQVGGKRTYKARGKQNGGDPIGGIALASSIGAGSLVLLLIIYLIYRSRGARPMGAPDVLISSQGVSQTSSTQSEDKTQLDKIINTSPMQPELIYGTLPPEIIYETLPADIIYSELPRGPNDPYIPNIELTDEQKNKMIAAKARRTDIENLTAARIEKLQNQQMQQMQQNLQKPAPMTPSGDIPRDTWNWIRNVDQNLMNRLTYNLLPLQMPQPITRAQADNLLSFSPTGQKLIRWVDDATRAKDPYNMFAISYSDANRNPHHVLVKYDGNRVYYEITDGDQYYANNLAELLAKLQ